MASCPSYSNPSRTRRVVVSAAPECSPGSGRTKGLYNIPVFENFNPLQPDFEVISLNRAKPGLGPDGFAAGLGFYRLTGNINVYGSGYGNMPPSWTTLLEAAGFEATRYVSTSTSAVATTSVTLTAGTDPDGDMESGYYYYRFSKVVNGVEEKLTTPGGPSSNVEVFVGSGDDSVTIDFATSTSAFDVNDVVRIYRSRVQPTAVGGSGLTYYFVAQVTLTNSTTGEEYLDTYGDLELAEGVPDQTTGTDVQTIWRPLSEGHKSLTVWTWLDHARYPATGVRGNINFQAEVGQIMTGAIDFSGVYNTRVTEANPSTATNPGIPPRVCGIDLTITPDGESPLTPIVKSFGINLGTQISQRLDGNNAECLIENGIFNQFDPRWTTQIEVDSTSDYLNWFKNNKLFALQATIQPSTSPTGKRVMFYTPATVAQLASAPQFDDSNGVRVINLEFQLTDPNGTNQFLYIKHY